MNTLKLGISIGDVNGIGPEVILKVLTDERMLDICTPVIYGSTKTVAYHKNILKGENFKFQSVESGEKAIAQRINVVNCWNENVNITLGETNETGGKYAYIALERAVKELKEKKIDVLVTAPINKKAMNMANFPHSGHTEYLTQQAGKQGSLMLMVNDTLRVGLVTTHIPVKDIAQNITKEQVLKKIKMMHTALQVDFGIEKPLIAVLGLNPHAGDEGVLGKEEEQHIRPAIIEAKKKGALVMGPYPADGFFGSNQYRKFDGILAMYHDQGLVAFKAMSFGEGVNYTAGLPFIRTSPDHGTAYDLAGKNKADESSFRKAMYLAKDIFTHRTRYFEDRANIVEQVDIEIEEQPEG